MSTNTKRLKILYVHGMGGGGSSRIPSILNEHINSYVADNEQTHIEVYVETYDFNPVHGNEQILGRVQRYRPDLIIGESLGSIHAIGIKGIPHLLVSPSINAPLYLTYLSPLVKIPGVTNLVNSFYKPREGDRQKLDFTYENMSPWLRYRDIALDNSPAKGSKDYFYAFFGTKDHYRKSGVVRVSTYKKYFGNSYTIYKGTHFMEEEFIHSLLIPKALQVLGVELRSGQ